MRILNISKNMLLATQVELAQGLFSRTKGLLGKKEIPEGFALVIQPCKQIHTFFMQFPIDVLFLDRNQRVIKVIVAMPPFSISGIYFNSRLAIEMPAYTLSKSQTQVGDVIRLEG